MIKKIFILTFIFFLCSCVFLYVIFPSNNEQFVAYIRVKNEIKTIEACLDSIEGIFDRIVIIHSNEADDGSIALMRQRCAKQKSCEIHEYPYMVIPSHEARPQEKKISSENTLAAYNNFGLQFFKSDDWVVKIDADQIYITSELQKTIHNIRKLTQDGNDKYVFGIKGYNTLPYKKRIVKFKKHPVNGGFDSFIIKRKNIVAFVQNRYYETLKTKTDLKAVLFSSPHWFHFMKSLKSRGQILPNDSLKETDIINLTPIEKKIYQTTILPRLQKAKSPYIDLSY